MARKAFISSYKLFDSATVTTSTVSSEANVLGVDYASIALVWSASDLVATVAVQVRNGERDAWRDIDFGSVPAISGLSGAHDLVFTQLPFTDLRVAITVTGGTAGTVNATLTAKSEGV